MPRKYQPSRGGKYGEGPERHSVTGESDTDVEKGEADETDTEVGREWDESAVEWDEPVIHVELDDDGNLKETGKK